MAKILLSLHDEDLLKNVTETLAESRHTLHPLKPLKPGDGLAEAADLILAEKAEVLVMDYCPEDATSVKLMQTVFDASPLSPPEFIFIEPAGQNTEREQIIMAFNEGAHAFLTADFQPAALTNYVERAVSGPGRLRQKAKPSYSGEDTEQLEEILGGLRVRIAGFQKLIAFLLSTPVNLQDRKVLLVSDSPYQLEMLKKILSDHGFKVITAPSLDEGLNLALAERPRFIVSDLELEGQTGLDFCQAVKFTHKITPCYFIICTASQDKAAWVMSPGNGIDDCLIKPAGQSDTTEFVSRIALGLML